MTDLLLAIEDVGVIFKDDKRSFGVFAEQFFLRRGETVLLQAPSGFGKSTLLALLGVALQPTHAGRFDVYIPGEGRIDVAAAWRRNVEADLSRLRRLVFGFVLQTGALADFLNVRENVTSANLFGPRQNRADIDQIVERLGIAPLMSLMPAQLSVGQRQRVAVARALASEPLVVLADEPTASLDVDLADEVEGLLATETRERDAALVMSSHRPDADIWQDTRRAEVRTERGDAIIASIFSHQDQAA